MFQRLRAFLKRTCIQQRPEFKEKPKPYVDPVTAAKRERDVLIFSHQQAFDQICSLDAYYWEHFSDAPTPLIECMSPPDLARRRELIDTMYKIETRLEELVPILNDAD